MKVKTIKAFAILSVAVFVLSLTSSEALATNGYFSHGYGTQSKAMAGVGVALPLNTMDAASNPATMVFLGNRYDVAVSLFNPNREYTITGNPSMMEGTFGLAPGTVESDTKTFFIPSLGANWMLNPQSSFGLSIFGNGGMNTDYDTNTFWGTTPTGVNISQLFVSGTYARKINDNHGLGISAIFAYQYFSADGLEAFGGFSTDASKLTGNDNSNSTGFGFRVGYMGYILPNLSLGASYQSKIYMSEFDDYAGLFAEKGDFDIPANWTVGLAYNATDALTFAVDVQQVLYSGIKSINNPMNPTDFQQGILLGSDDGAGFGWDDMMVYKFGVQYAAIPSWTFRAGYSFGEQPIPESEVMFNILAPGVIEQHITFGLSKMVGEKEVSLSVMHAFSNSISGANPMEVPGQQEIELKMDQWEVEIGFAF